MTPSDKLLYEALIRIRNLTELAAFKALIADELRKEVTMMVAQNDDKVMWRAQGAVRTLTKLQNLIEDSKGVLDKPRPLTAVGGTGFLSSNSP